MPLGARHQFPIAYLKAPTDTNLLEDGSRHDHKCLQAAFKMFEPGVSIVNGYTYVDHLSWDAYNESSDLSLQTELYRQRFGILPKEVQADKIYHGKDNRKYIREKHMDSFNHPLIVEDVTGYCGRRNGGVQLTIND